MQYEMTAFCLDSVLLTRSVVNLRQKTYFGFRPEHTWVQGLLRHFVSEQFEIARENLTFSLLYKSNTGETEGGSGTTRERYKAAFQ